MEKNTQLFLIRKERNKTQKEFADDLGIPVKTYVSYENGIRMPRPKLAAKLAKKLGVTMLVFYFPQSEDSQESNNGESITERIAVYMKAKSKAQGIYKPYKALHVSLIRKAVTIEREERDKDHIDINPKTKAGKLLINKRTALEANKEMKMDFFNWRDILLYKQCRAEELEDRGKCSWGFKNERKRRGFNQQTGREIISRITKVTS